MNLTKKVISKMQQQNMDAIKGPGAQSDTQSVRTDSTIPNRPESFEGEFQLRQYDSFIKQQQIEVKRLQDEKTNLVMKFEVNQKDHAQYVTVKNDLWDVEREKSILIMQYEELVSRIEGTRDVIQKNTEDSGKERKVL